MQLRDIYETFKTYGCGTRLGGFDMIDFAEQRLRVTPPERSIRRLKVPLIFITIG
jgi:hypothetical protein